MALGPVDGPAKSGYHQQPSAVSQYAAKEMRENSPVYTYIYYIYIYLAQDISQHNNDEMKWVCNIV